MKAVKVSLPIDKRCTTDFDVSSKVNKTNKKYKPIFFSSKRGCLIHCPRSLFPCGVLHWFSKPRRLTDLLEPGITGKKRN
jgi:hypothetical protein